MIPTFSRHLGVGFQILNDLKDWQGDGDNKLIAEQDALAQRPTVLLALALQGADKEQQAELQQILTAEGQEALRAGRLRRIFNRIGVFGQADALVDKSRARAEALADDVENEHLRQLLYFFVDTVLAAHEDVPKPDPSVLVSLPVTTAP